MSLADQLPQPKKPFRKDNLWEVLVSYSTGMVDNNDDVLAREMGIPEEALTAYLNAERKLTSAQWVKLQRWLHTRIDTPLVDLIGHPVLEKVDEIGIYEYSTERPGPTFIRPNTYERLDAAGFWSLDKPIDVEAGTTSLFQLPRAHAKSFDEHFHKSSRGLPGRKHLYPGLGDTQQWTHELTDYEGMAQALKPHILRCVDAGHEPRLIESWPDPNGWRPHLKAMLDRAWELAPWGRMVWDVNITALENEAPRMRWWRFGRPGEKQRRYWNDRRDDLRDMHQWAVDRQIPTAVIIGSPTGRHVTTEAGFVAYARKQMAYILEAFHPDVWIVQSWEDNRETQGYPKAFPSLGAMAQIVDHVWNFEHS
jgi:hypothetical protein